MPEHIVEPVLVTSAGNLPKKIAEFVGRASNNESRVSIAHMTSPSGWTEPGQRPAFDEYTVVLRGELSVEHDDGQFHVKAGEVVITRAGEWVRYSTPHPAGAEYIAICLPAFSPETVHRDDDTFSAG